MLVGAFQIQIRRPFQVRSHFKAKGVGGAGIKPDIENVPDLLPIFHVRDKAVEESLFGTIGIPGICTFFGKHILDAGHQLIGTVEFRAWNDLPGLDMAEHGDRHAPGTLARQYPVRAVGNHAMQARLSALRHKAGFLDCRKRCLAQCAHIGL